MTGPIGCTYGQYPELNKYKDKIWIVYAGCASSTTSFVNRTNEDIVKEIITAINSGHNKIIFHNAAETLLQSVTKKAQAIVNIAPMYNDTMFFLHTAGYEAQKEYDKMKEIHNWTRKLNILASDHFEYIVKEFSKGLYSQVVPEYKIKLKERKFVCLNKVDRSHRVQLLARVLKEPGLLDKSFYSFEGTRPDWYKNLYNRFGQSVVATYIKNQHVFPLRLNITETRSNPIDLIPEDLYYHDESYFSLVTETVFYNIHEPGRTQSLLDSADGVFLSEKTYRPIALKHPFILLAFPNSLQMLRDRGYKTFSPYINEDYDSELNGEERLNMIFDEVLRLCSFTDDQWIEWQTNIKSIVEFNFEVLKNRTNFGLHPVEHLFAS